MSNIYARVIDGSVVEYPVLAEYIVNRGHPFTLYTKVLSEEIPLVDKFKKYIPKVQFIEDRVIVTYDIVNFTLNEVFNNIYFKTVTPQDMVNGTVAKEDVFIKDLDLSTINVICKGISDYGQTYLDAYIDKLDLYHSNTFANDIVNIGKLRTKVWTVIYKAINDILSGVKPIPRSVSEIDAVLPT